MTPSDGPATGQKQQRAVAPTVRMRQSKKGNEPLATHKVEVPNLSSRNSNSDGPRDKYVWPTDQPIYVSLATEIHSGGEERVIISSNATYQKIFKGHNDVKMMYTRQWLLAEGRRNLRCGGK